MTRVRRRANRYRRGEALEPHARWLVTTGGHDPNRHWFASDDDLADAYQALRDDELTRIPGGDLAAGFEGFWRHEPGVPEELRRGPHPYAHVLGPGTHADYLAHLEARRTWLRSHDRGAYA